MVVGLVLLAVTAPLGLPWVTALCAIFTSGGALAMPVVTSVVLDGVAPAQAGAVSAVFNTFRQVGRAVAIAVFGAPRERVVVVGETLLVSETGADARHPGWSEPAGVFVVRARRR